MVCHIFLVDRLTNLVNTADHRIEEAKQSGEGKIDKLVFISYIYEYFLQRELEFQTLAMFLNLNLSTVLYKIIVEKIFFNCK